MIHPDDPEAIRRAFRRLPTGMAGDAALHLFCSPQLSERRHPEQRKLVERARFHLRHASRTRVPTPVGEVQVYQFAPDVAVPAGTVLMVHGWTSEASFMTALAEPLRRSGFRVVLFDLPAHGSSAGRRTNLIDCARATLAVGEALGPIDAVVAHSVGGMMAMLAIEGGRPMPRRLHASSAVLIACPDRLGEFTRDFATHWGIADAGRMAFEQRLERIGHRPIGCYSTAAFLRTSGCPALVVHARNDADVPFRCAETIAAASPAAQLAAFDGFGHRNILFAPPVVRAVVKFLQSKVRAVS